MVTRGLEEHPAHDLWNSYAKLLPYRLELSIAQTSCSISHERTHSTSAFNSHPNDTSLFTKDFTQLHRLGSAQQFPAFQSLYHPEPLHREVNEALSCAKVGKQVRDEQAEGSSVTACPASMSGLIVNCEW